MRRSNSRSYSITSLARTSIDGERLTPSDLAVFVFTTSSNFVGCSMGQIGGLCALQKLRNQASSLPPHQGKPWSVGQQAPGLNLFSPLVDRRQTVFGGQPNDLPRQRREER